MSYRRRPDHDIEREWRDWLRAHSSALAELGLPLALYSSRTTWGDFISGGLAAYTDRGISREYDFNSLSVEQQKRLLDFLERAMGTRDPPPVLLGFLRERARHGWVPPFRS